jgi:hypothetical protein
MTIRLLFSVNKEPFRITIYNREIYYSDRLWGRPIRLIPKDKDFIKKIIMSRNKIPSILKEMFELTQKEQEEYENAKTEEELTEICIRDTKSKGGLFLNKEIILEEDIDNPSNEENKKWNYPKINLNNKTNFNK